MRMIFCFLFCLFSTPLISDEHSFKEVWTYVFKGEERYLKGNEPITDIAYFSAIVNEIGRLGPAPDIAQIPPEIKKGRRIHLVISSPSNLSLMYWCLSKDKETRSLLIQDILEAAKPFDGLQIDFERMRPDEGDAYVAFLKEIREKLPKEKIFSVALVPKVKEVKNAFDYVKISQVTDKIIVMAYDEHYGSGPAGPIASLSWCEKVCGYSQTVVPKQKLVMGLPLYGRVWQKEGVAKALKYFQTLDLWKEHPNLLKRDADGTPHFSFEQPVHAEVYFEDVQSIGSKLSHYEKSGIEAVAFWRQSQGPAAIWSNIQAR